MNTHTSYESSEQNKENDKVEETPTKTNNKIASRNKKEN